jgi:energy-coupling factor transport system substrate-specific component
VSPSLLLVALLLAFALALVAVELGGRRGPNLTKELALAATLAAAAAGGRVLFAFVPNVQPVTFVVSVTGVALGPRTGIAVGATAALASNAFLGQGPWTPWQMLGWGLAGATAGWLAPLLRHRFALAAFGAAWGFLFDWIVSIWAWSALADGGSDASFVAFIVAGLPFDVAHAAGNVVLALAAGPTAIRVLDRYARRLSATFVPLEEPR